MASSVETHVGDPARGGKGPGRDGAALGRYLLTHTPIGLRVHARGPVDQVLLGVPLFGSLLSVLAHRVVATVAAVAATAA